MYASSTKQKVVGKSSTEAELIGLTDGSSQIVWARDYLQHQGYSTHATIVNQDNKSTIVMATKGKSNSGRSKHINVRYFYIKDRIDAGELVLQYLPTEQMVADILTKPLQGALFRSIRSKLLNEEMKTSEENRK